MANKKGRRKTTRKSTVRNRKRKEKKKTTKNQSMVILGQGFPKKMIMTHKFSTAILLPTASGALTTYNLSCNGMFDPDPTAAATRPMYFAQMAALYDHYTVIGSKIVIKACASGTGFGAGTFGVYRNDDTTVTPTTVDWCNEQSSSNHRFIAAGSNETYTFTNKWSAKKTFGGSVLGNDNLQGSATANPTEQTYWTIYTASIDPGTADFDTAFEVDITYIAVWDELKDITGSTG